MADIGSSIFNKKASEKLCSPDDLDKYVRVTNPSVWVVLVACVALLVGFLSWGMFGAVTTSVNTTGTYAKGSVICFLTAEDAAKVSVGDSANVGGEIMEVKSISSVPLSRDEAKAIVEKDYLVSTLIKGDWAYIVYFTGGDESEFVEEVPLPVNITTEHVAPMSLIFGGTHEE